MPPLDPTRLNLLPRHRETLLALLADHVPTAHVWAYGSRVTGGAHEGSDLDLALRDPVDPEAVPIGWDTLKAALTNSNLPMLVDIHIWPHLPETFRTNIEAGYVVLRTPL